jgi:hypothetical protein
MEGGETQEPTRFCIEINVPRGERKLSILQLHSGATLQSAVEATVDHCKTVYQLIGDEYILNSYPQRNSCNITYFYEIHREFTSPSSSPLLRHYTEKTIPMTTQKLFSIDKSIHY